MKQLIYCLMYIGIISCQQSENKTNITENSPKEMDIKIEQRNFGKTEGGDTVTLFSLTNLQGMTMEVMDYGGIITSLTAPDRKGNYQDVVLGFDNFQQYLDGHPFFGALVGRYGNRIAGAKFTLDGEEFSLVQNNGENHLHGGTKGFDKVIWLTKASTTSNGPMLELSYTSAHLEEGFPGELEVKVTYTLGNDNSLKVDYHAVTDKSTIVNLTQHSYFNLNPDAPTILDHQLVLNADNYLPVDQGLIPLGSLDNVAGTPFDFTKEHIIGERIDTDHEQISRGGGYDHCWALNGEDGAMKTAAIVYDPATGREMTVKTTEPGVQFYSANFMDGSLTGKGKIYQKRGALCLETQHYPDSPNQPDFPSTRLDPGDTYRSTTVFKFDAR